MQFVDLLKIFIISGIIQSLLNSMREISEIQLDNLNISYESASRESGTKPGSHFVDTATANLQLFFFQFSIRFCHKKNSVDCNTIMDIRSQFN